ncbi:MAG TPA: hydantoinase/carbamoylase family amidase [Thermoleophilaceae bacterium]|nr:hydantoinase/carbamoylase family amidase [Thermoleophilaceae bacterium]
MAAGVVVIEASELAARLETLVPIGRGPLGTTRLAWTGEDAATGEWFREQAAGAGLRVEQDPAGNLWAVPDAPPPWWAVGSHLDSVREGGSFDGALGVAAGFEVAAQAGGPIAVISFADEEGARFNTPTFGSRALTGVLDLGVLDRVDRDGIRLADGMRAAGVDPARIGDAPDWLSRLRGFVELHIDQTTELQRAGIPAGVVRGLASRMRLRADIEGRADHSGTTPPADRRDALAAAARLIVAALDRSGDGLVATASRIEVEPNALTTVPAHASVWLDARSPDPERVDAWRAELEALDVGLPVALSLESRSAGCEFDPRLRERLVALSEALGARAPEMECYAGHDAGLIAARLPAAMALVRNETGVSHSPAEHVELEDAAFGAELVLRLLRELPA